MVDRYLPSVIDDIIKKIPNEPDWGGLVNQLESIKSGTYCTAPEVTSIWWNGAALVLNSCLGTPDTLWKKEIIKIFSGRELDA